MNRGLPKEMQFGGFLDLSTVGGTIRSIIIVLLGSFFIWNAHHVFDWVYSVLGIESVPDSESTIRIRRFWAGVAAGTMMLLGGANILWLCWYRKQAVKSAEGQWYDNASLSKEDLYEDGGNNIAGRKED